MATKPKKILLWTGIIILVTVLCFYGYIKYQQHKSYQTQIHKNTNALIRVDVYALYKSMLSDYLSRKKTQRRPMFEGIIVPANIFLFSVKDKQPTTLFTSFQLDDAAAFSVSIKKHFDEVQQLAGGINLIESKDQRWAIAYGDKKVALAFSANKEKVAHILLDMLQDKNMTGVSSGFYKDISNQDGHITYLSQKDKASINFNKGNIKLDASLASIVLQTPSTVSHQQRDKDDAVQFWLYADMAPWLTGQNFMVDTIEISGNELLTSKPKGVELTLGKSVSQKDSVVTFEYNDNFEKVAQATVRETLVPGLSFLVNADTAKLLAYLQQQNIVNKDSGTVNKNVFPLYQLYTSGANDYLQISTMKGAPNMRTMQTANTFFGLYINFAMLQQQEELTMLRKYMTPLETLEANATKASSNAIILKATLNFKNKDKQTLWSLLELMP